MTRSRVSGSKLSSARPLRTRDTVDACTFAARATSVIVTRLVAKPLTLRPEIDFFDYTPAARRWFRQRAALQRRAYAGLAVDLLAKLLRREHVDVATCDSDQAAVLEVHKHLVDRHARRADGGSELVLRECERMRIGLSAA